MVICSIFFLALLHLKRCACSMYSLNDTMLIKLSYVVELYTYCYHYHTTYLWSVIPSDQIYLNYMYLQSVQQSRSQFPIDGYVTANLPYSMH